ncbi:MAG: ATP-binding protein [Motiliproteus sp.]
MSLTQTLNLRHDALIERMAVLVDLNAQLPCAFRGVFTQHNGTWSLLMGVVTFSEDDDELEACNHRYPDFQFIARPLEGVTLSELMVRLNNGEGLPFADLPDLSLKDSDLNWTESLIPSHANEGVYPERLYSSQVCASSSIHCHDDKLIAHGVPFHPSAFDYVREFLGIERFHGSSDGRKGELSILIPDRRGYLTVSDQEVTFSCKSDETYSVVGAIDGEPVQLNNPAEVFKVEIENASDVELWLITGSDEIIDYRSSSVWEYRYDTQANNTDVTKLLQIITAGESEHCEFKQYIDLGNRKAWEIDKAVCAFSNHQGGKLFIGVDDDTRIIGINEGCQRHYKCDPRDAVERYREAVTKRLQESLIKNQCFETYLIDHNELFVLVVEVHKPRGLNYLRLKNEAYIRRGASSPQMALAEVQAFPRETETLGRV